MRARAVSVGFLLLVGFAVDAPIGLALHGARGLPLGRRVEHDARRRVLIAMGGMFDQVPLGQLEALGLASPRLLDGAARFAPTHFELVDSIVAFVHAPNTTLTCRPGWVPPRAAAGRATVRSGGPPRPRARSCRDALPTMRSARSSR